MLQKQWRVKKSGGEMYLHTSTPFILSKTIGLLNFVLGEIARNPLNI